MNELQERFFDDGAVHLEGALDPAAVRLAEAAFAWSLNNPGPAAREVLAGVPGAFYQDHANPKSFPAYRALLCDTGLADLVCSVMGSESLWLMYEQIWLKEGVERRRTPWHQDLAYIPVGGDHLAVAWTNLDPVLKEDSLEFVRGSHRGPLFNPTAFDPRDPAASMFPDGDWPPLPDIEAAREKWPIVSWAVKPGDIVLFHPAILHGGAPTRAGRRRRSISLRFFGDECYCAERPDRGLADVDRLKFDDGSGDPIKAMAHVAPGTLFRHPAFARLR